jgi:hypothetical protein
VIRANVRNQLGPRDIDLMLLLLSRGSAGARAGWQRRLAVEGPDALLDQPDLFERLLTVRAMLVPSEALLFYVMVRHALLRADLDDRDLADYLAALLLDFGRRDRAWRVDWNDDANHRYVVDILADLAASDGLHQFKVMAHLGNYTLWLAGIFPEYIAARRLRRGGPDVSYYDAMGRRGFALASDHAMAETHGLDGVFRIAAERFPHVRRALNTVSERVLFARSA